MELLPAGYPPPSEDIDTRRPYAAAKSGTTLPTSLNLGDVLVVVEHVVGVVLCLYGASSR